MHILKMNVCIDGTPRPSASECSLHLVFRIPVSAEFPRYFYMWVGEGYNVLYHLIIMIEYLILVKSKTYSNKFIE
jgi:hypothetical protein